MAPKRKSPRGQPMITTPTRKCGGLRPKETTKSPKTKPRVQKGRISKSSGSATEKKRKRRTKRVKLSVFGAKAIESKNPGVVLTAHSKFVDDIPKRMLKLEDKEKKQCALMITLEMEGLEEEIMNRYATLKSLRVQGDAESIRRKDRLMEFMEIQITELQAVIKRRRENLDLERDTLQSFHMKRFLCCKICARQSAAK